jgi:hypothetical protein
MKKKQFLTESDRKQILADKEKAILESFAKTFNKIKRIDENELTQNNDRETIVTLLKNEEFEYSTKNVDILSWNNGSNSKLKITFEGYEYTEEEWPGHSGLYELNVTFNFYYKISGSYSPAKWGYDGGSDAEYPEVEFYFESIEEAFYGVNDGESILEIPEDLKDMLFAEMESKFDMEKLDIYIWEYIKSNDDGGY